MKTEHVAQWAEVVGNFGVVITLVFLILEVADNSKAIRSQAYSERGTAVTEQFMGESPLPAIAAKVKQVDGPEPLMAAFMERYDLSYEESAVWARHILSTWTVLESEYALRGESDGLAQRMAQYLTFPDQQLWYEQGGPDWLNSDEFRAYLRRVHAGAP